MGFALYSEFSEFSITTTVYVTVLRPLTNNRAKREVFL